MRTLLPFFLLACADPQEPAASWEGPLATDLGWAQPVGEPAPPPVIASLVQVDEAMVGTTFDLRVGGIAAGVDVILIASLQGPGVGPCHPSGVCVDLLAPRVVDSTISSGSGVARFTVSPPGARDVAFQAVVLDPAGAGVSDVVLVSVASVAVTWNYDQVEIVVENGESAYDFGMAETMAGPVGWYGEDCFPGNFCHTVSGSLLLQSVHGGVGGPGLGYVVPSSTTLFYDIHDPAITYYLRGLDSGACWAWGDDPSYYPGCTEL